MHHFLLDASALGKRYVIETGTERINHFMRIVPRERLGTMVITVSEIVSILVRRRNAGDLSQNAFAQAVVEFRQEVVDAPDFTLHSVSDELILRSLPLIDRYAINATDALLLRAALDITELLRERGDDLVLITSDIRLETAAIAAKLLTWNPESDSQETVDSLLAQS